MGSIWLRDLPDVVRSAGLTCMTWPGWETRARSSGGYDALLGIVVHHTASSATSTEQDNCRYQWEVSTIKPVGAMLLGRSGTVWVGAAGATNHAGAGGPWGPIAQDNGNRTTIGIEAQNDGRGQEWPQVQQDAYVALVTALVKAYNIPVGNVIAHHEWAPTRKVDPSGPSRFARRDDPYLRWNMDAFRGEVFRRLLPPPPPPPPPVSGCTAVVQRGESPAALAGRVMGVANDGSTWLVRKQFGDAIVAANPDVVWKEGAVVRLPGKHVP